LPLDIVEGEGFKLFIKALEPRYQIPHRKTITSDLDDKFVTAKQFLKSKICKVKWINLTCDIWTDNHNVKSYLSLTSHFIQKIQMESIVLSVKPMESTHTSDNIKSLIEEILGEWSISQDQVVCCITDCGANITKACQDLFGKNKHLRCIAHLINLMVSETIEYSSDFEGVIKDVKDIVTFFKQSVKASDRLRFEQQKSGVSILKLIQAVKTRWNSVYYMLERFVTLNRFIIPVLSDIDGPQLLGNINFKN
jgi:hypothetical protein